MSLNSTVSAERLHIGFFGLRNAGKSSLVNAVTGQSLSVVSSVLGTTTDPVKKSMELLPLGPVLIIDTPGFDDEGALGNLRVEKTRKVLATVDVAVLVVDSTRGLSELDYELISLFQQRNVPYIIAYNKCDLATVELSAKNEIAVSAENSINIKELKELIGSLNTEAVNNKKIVSDLIKPGDTVVLVTPIDESAPKGRIILPQQQTLREVLDSKAIAVFCQPEELSSTIKNLVKKPKLVITDSQAFGKVSAILPEDITLTSFSILFARYKGDLEVLTRGAAALNALRDGDKILVCEGCTHHRQCGDIGTVKIPAWVRNYTGKELEFEFTSGGDFPENLKDFAMIIHCGGCMLNQKEMKYRINTAEANGVPVVNYGVLIAHVHGILKRSLAPFPNVQKLLDTEV